MYTFQIIKNLFSVLDSNKMCYFVFVNKNAPGENFRGWSINMDKLIETQEPRP